MTQPTLTQADWIALARYVSGEATREERAALDRRAARDAVFAQLISDAGIAWTTASVVPRVRDKQAAWAAIVRRLLPPVSYRTTAQEDGGGASRREARFKTHLPRKIVWPTATAFVLGILVTVVGWLAIARHGDHRTSDSVLTYTTARGERATITLPDGGTVSLNVASRLDIPSDYKAGNHAVRLTGEGLFTLPHHDRASFTVLAGPTITRVLGTSFVVRRYATDSATTVAVRDGKVALASTVVTANQVAELGASGVPRLRTADATSFSFVSGVLTLDGLSFPAAIVELNRWYDADIRLGDPELASRHVKGLFAAGSLGDLATILEWTYDVRVVRDGRVLTLYPRQ